MSKLRSERNKARKLHAANKRIKELEKKNRELEELNEFLEETSAFFAANRRKSGRRTVKVHFQKD